MRHSFVRLVLAALLVSALTAPGASAAVTVVSGQTKVASTANPFNTDGVDTLTFDSATTPGNQIIVGVALPTDARSINLAMGGVSDGSNTYDECNQGGQDATIGISGAAEVWLFCAPVTGAITAITVTLSSAVAANALFFIMEVTGQHSTPIEDVAVATTSAQMTHSSGNLVTANAGSLLVGIALGSAGTYTQAVGWTNLDTDATLGAMSGYLAVDAATTVYNPTSAQNENAAIAAIAIAPAAAAGTRQRSTIGAAVFQ